MQRSFLLWERVGASHMTVNKELIWPNSSLQILKKKKLYTFLVESICIFLVELVYNNIIPT